MLNGLPCSWGWQAMVEEVRSVSIGRGAERKERRLVGVVSASCPYYLYGDVEDVYDGDDTPLPKPIVGAYAVVGILFATSYCGISSCILPRAFWSSPCIYQYLYMASGVDVIPRHHAPPGTPTGLAGRCVG